MRKTRPAVAGYEDGRGSQAKECGQPVEAGKTRKQLLLEEPPQRDTAYPLLWFQPREIHFGHLTFRIIRQYICVD